MVHNPEYIKNHWTVHLTFSKLLFFGSMWDLSSPTRDQTCGPAMGAQSLNHWTTRKIAYTL